MFCLWNFQILLNNKSDPLASLITFHDRVRPQRWASPEVTETSVQKQKIMPTPDEGCKREGSVQCKIPTPLPPWYTSSETQIWFGSHRGKLKPETETQKPYFVSFCLFALYVPLKREKPKFLPVRILLSTRLNSLSHCSQRQILWL